MVKKCILCQLQNRTKPGQNVTYYRFPKHIDENLRFQYSILARYPDALIDEHSRICSSHVKTRRKIITKPKLTRKPVTTFVPQKIDYAPGDPKMEITLDMNSVCMICMLSQGEMKEITAKHKSLMHEANLNVLKSIHLPNTICEYCLGEGINERYQANFVISKMVFTEYLNVCVRQPKMGYFDSKFGFRVYFIRKGETHSQNIEHVYVSTFTQDIDQVKPMPVCEDELMLESSESPPPQMHFEQKDEEVDPLPVVEEEFEIGTLEISPLQKQEIQEDEDVYSMSSVEEEFLIESLETSLVQKHERHRDKEVDPMPVTNKKFLIKSLEISPLQKQDDEPMLSPNVTKQRTVVSRLEIPPPRTVVRKKKQPKSSTCNNCGKDVASIESFLLHRKKCKTKKTFVCGKCPETFWNQVLLNIHKRKH